MEWRKIKKACSNTLWTIIAIPAWIILALLASGAWIGLLHSCHESPRKETPNTSSNINGLYSTDYDGNGYSDNDEEEEPVYVWICTGEYSHAYHSDPDCEGLQYCKGEIEMIEWEEAQDMGRTPCHFCHDED